MVKHTQTIKTMIAIVHDDSQPWISIDWRCQIFEKNSGGGGGEFGAIG